MERSKRKTKIQRSEEKDKEKEHKAIESMLAKSENYWNKIMPEQKETLNTLTAVKIFQSTEKEYLSKNNDPLQGIGFITLLKNEVVFREGKVYVNAADPTTFCWNFSIQERYSLNLYSLSMKFNGDKGNRVKDKAQTGEAKEKAQDSEITESDYKAKENDEIPEPPRESNVLEGEEAYKRLSMLGFPDDSLNRDCLFLIIHDGIYLFMLFEELEEALHWTSCFKILLKAQNLSYRGTKDDYPGKKREWLKEKVKDKDCRAESRTRRFFVWILDNEVDSLLYRELKVTLWSKNGEVTYFLTIDMRKSMKEIKTYTEKCIRNELYINQMLIRSYINYFEVSRFFLKLSKTFDISLETKGMSMLREKFDKEDKDKFLYIDEPDDYEKGKAPFSKFWHQRRFIVKNYKRMYFAIVPRRQVSKKQKKKKKSKMPKIQADSAETKAAEEQDEFKIIENIKRQEALRKQEERKKLEDLIQAKKDPQYEYHRKRRTFIFVESEASKVYNKILQGIKETDSRMLKAFKLVQVQKQHLRVELMRDCLHRGKVRGMRCGKRAARRDAYIVAKKEKTVVKATTSVLKLLMFQEARPELIPDNLRNKMDDSENKRDGCCLIF